MSIRIILAPLFGDASDARALKAGLGIAQRLKAHLAALFVRIDRAMPFRSSARGCRRRSSSS